MDAHGSTHHDERTHLMSDTSKNTGADGIQAGSADDVRDEVRLDLDEGDLDNWDKVRDTYAVDPDTDVTRPALTENEDDDADDLPHRSEDGEEDEEAEGDDERADEEEE